MLGLPLAFKLRVDSVLEICTGAKVDELQLSSVEVKQNVLVLDVKMDDTGRMNLPHCCDELNEELSSRALWQTTILRDEIKQVHHVPETRTQETRHFTDVCS